ncbi:hypothetical protein OQA88_3637 [Cercophora sp. LCS_1]
MAAPQGDAKDANDGEKFWGYLFDKGRPIPNPTPLLNALLRAIGLHIIAEIGDKNDEFLTPTKLAAFYKAAGHDYDSLFIEMPRQSISFIYQVEGCQHILLQEKDTEPPSIPALTPKGFVRFQSIQILLDPLAHTPVMQYAVRNWALKNPDTGVMFPTDLPAESFPLVTDPDADRWHQTCAVKLREQATPKEDPKPTAREPKAGPHDPKFPFQHVPPPSHDYFGRPVNVSYIRVPPTGAPRATPVNRSPERPRERERERHPDRERDRPRDWDRERGERLHDHYPRRQGSSSDEPARRPRSFEHVRFPPESRSMHLPRRAPEVVPAPRRHSQPRHHSSSSDSEGSEVSPRTEKMRRRDHRSNDPPPVSQRRIYDDGPRIVTSHPHLPSMAEDAKRGPISDIKEKLKSFLPVGTAAEGERRRSGSRGRKDDGFVHVRSTGGPKEGGLPGSKLRGSWSDFGESDSDTSPHSRRQRKQDRERDRAREREQKERDREKSAARERERALHLKEPRDRDRDSDDRKNRAREKNRDRAGTDRSDRLRRSREPSEEDLSPKSRSRGGTGSGPFLVRPDEAYRRASSHADLDRKREWDARERDRDRARDERYRDRDRGRERNWDRDRASRERDRDLRDAARLASPSKGVTGRVYPDWG